MKNKPRLGRGIDALFSETLTDEAVNLVELSLAEIAPNPIQPRKDYAPGALSELTESIRSHGVIAPIVVRRVDARYEIIAGERRYRAAQLAGLDRIPAIVRACEDDEAFRLSLIENLQREDLNPMEEAEAYHTLAKLFHHTHQEIAAAVSKDRSTITNALRLMGLPEEVKQSLREGRITTGHARAVLMLATAAEQRSLLAAIETHGLSVREAEQRAAHAKRRPAQKVKRADPLLDRLALSLSDRFSTKVTCDWGKKKGRIVIEVYSKDELTRIAQALSEAEGPL